jgi:hypothetical protein
LTSFTKQNFRGRLFPPLCQLPQVGGQCVEGGLNIADERLAKNFPMLGFGRTAVPRRATLQASDQIVVQIAHMQVPNHAVLHEIIDLNDLTWRQAGQGPYDGCVGSRWHRGVFSATPLVVPTSPTGCPSEIAQA